jgi:hypothetical protein
VPRFCPTAPGSTVFKYPSSIYNPGPGTYYNSIKWNDVGMLEKTRQNYNSEKHGDLVVKPQSRAPSIPSKKIPAQAYSGPKSEQVKMRHTNPDF